MSKEITTRPRDKDGGLATALRSAREIAFDTSALGRLLESPALAQLLCERVREGGTRVVFPGEALAEAFDQDDVSAVQARVDALRELFAACGDRIVIAPHGMNVATGHEWRAKNHPLFRTPRISGPQRQGLMHLLQSPNFGELHAQLREKLPGFLRKDITLGHDRAVRSQGLSGYADNPTPDDIAVALEPFAERVLSPPAYFLCWTTRSRKHRARVRRNPQRYRAAVTLAAYTLLNAVSAIFAEIGYGRFNEILRAPKRKERGTWVDGRIAAACAYADVLLCDDRGMRNKLNYIAREFSFPTQAIELDTWVGA